jgi:hypothetical protein
MAESLRHLGYLVSEKKRGRGFYINIQFVESSAHTILHCMQI